MLRERTQTPADGAHPALVVRGLSAGHAGRPVLRGLDLVVPPGTALRVRGRNGAGKTTLLRCLAGAHPLTAGQVLMQGHDLERDPARARAGLGLADGTCPFPYLTGREHLLLHRRVHGRPRDAVDELLDEFPGWACRDALDRQVRTWSRGMRQQLALLLAVAHRPGLLLLDESSDGLDDDALHSWTAFLCRYVLGGGTALLVEHRDQVPDLLPPAASRSVTLTDLTDLPDLPPLPDHPDPSLES